MTVFVVPRLPDGRLSAKEFVGGRNKLSALQTEFAAKVGRKHGLERGVEGSKATHTTRKEYYAQLAANPTLKPPVAPPEPSVMDVATGKAAKVLKKYAADLAKFAALAETEAGIARMGIASRNGQAKAVKGLRAEVTELSVFENQAATLRRQLDTKTQELDATQEQQRRLKSELAKAEQVITNQAATIGKYRSLSLIG